MVFPTLTTAVSRFLVDGLKAMEINDPIDQRIRIEGYLMDFNPQQLSTYF